MKANSTLCQAHGASRGLFLWAGAKAGERILNFLAGLSLEDWASIIAILSGIGGLILLIIRFTSVMNKLQSAIQTLNSTLGNLVNDNRDLHKRVERIEDRFEEHVGEAKVRNNRLDHLEKEIFKEKS